MCVQLGEFLRGTLKMSGTRAHLLRDELTHLRRYLAVEKARFGERLEVVEEVEASCLDCEVPTLLLQPLVENALKHGVATLVEGGTVTIRARLHGGRLVLAVENPLDMDANRRPGAGLGLANVRERLRGEHGEDAGLRAGESGGAYTVELRLPAIVEGERKDRSDD